MRRHLDSIPATVPKLRLGSTFDHPMITICVVLFPRRFAVKIKQLSFKSLSIIFLLDTFPSLDSKKYTLLN